MNKILFKGENLTHKEGYKIFEQFTNGLEEIEPLSKETEQITNAEFKKDEYTKVIVEAYYKNNNYDFEFLQITEVYYIDAKDFNNMNTLKDKYITNWNELPQQLQEFILSCDKYFIYNTQELILYKRERQAVASMGISAWYSDVKIESAGAGELFQWNIKHGFTTNNLKRYEFYNTEIMTKGDLKGYIQGEITFKYNNTEYNHEFLYRFDDSENGDNFKLVTIDYGYKIPYIEEVWKEIESYLKEVAQKHITKQ